MAAGFAEACSYFAAQRDALHRAAKARGATPRYVMCTRYLARDKRGQVEMTPDEFDKAESERKAELYRQDEQRRKVRAERMVLDGYSSVVRYAMQQGQPLTSSVARGWASSSSFPVAVVRITSLACCATHSRCERPGSGGSRWQTHGGSVHAKQALS